MARSTDQGQADKAASEQVTAQNAETEAQVAEREAEEARQAQQRQDNPAEDGPKSAAGKVLSAELGSAGAINDPYPAYDLMQLEQLQELAEQRGVQVNRDVLRAHYITELRAADTSGDPSVRQQNRVR
jgi:hypothetical protein